jgi:hypothetical protein
LHIERVECGETLFCVQGVQGESTSSPSEGSDGRKEKSSGKSLHPLHMSSAWLSSPGLQSVFSQVEGPFTSFIFTSDYALYQAREKRR